MTTIKLTIEADIPLPETMDEMAPLLDKIGAIEGITSIDVEDVYES